MNLWRRVFIERRAVVLPLMIFLLANVAVLALGVFPLGRSVASLREAEVDAAAARAQAMRLDLSAKAAQTGKERAEEELRKFYGEVLPSDAQAASKLTYFWLSRLAQESGVQFDRSTHKPEEIRESRLTRYTSKANLTGDYGNIRRFLYAVETAQEFVIIEEVGLTQLDSTRGGSLLELELSLATYYLTRTPTGTPTK